MISAEFDDIFTSLDGLAFHFLYSFGFYKYRMLKTNLLRGSLCGYFNNRGQLTNPNEKKIWTHWSVILSLPSKILEWRVGQGVKTPPFHGGITGSNPVRATIKNRESV